MKQCNIAKDFFFLLQCLFCSKIFAQKENISSQPTQPKQICVKYFTLQISVKLFTFVSASLSQ